MGAGRDAWSQAVPCVCTAGDVVGCSAGCRHAAPWMTHWRSEGVCSDVLLEGPEVSSGAVADFEV